jgi:arylsulfatase A-like enzyme
VKLPDGEGPRGARVPARVGLTDVLPTLVELLELAPPEAELDGRSLAGLLRDPSGPAPSPRLYTRARTEVGLHAVFDGDDKAVCRVVNGRDGELELRSVELYDLAADPGETRDLAAERPERARGLAYELLAQLRAFQAVARPVPPAHQEVQRSLLEDLGYAGGDDE